MIMISTNDNGDPVSNLLNDIVRLRSVVDEIVEASAILQ